MSSNGLSLVQNDPLVSVVLAVYNSENYLASAISSLLNQSHRNVELLCLDDGSSDRSPEICDDYARKDSRVTHVRFESNRGLPSALNHGIKIASGEYVARMDADDIATPDRFDQQLNFLNQHPEIDLVGGYLRTFGAEHRLWRYPTHPISARYGLVFKTTMSHPLFFFRRARWLQEGVRYDEAFPVRQDYMLLADYATKLRFCSIPRVLLQYRVHQQQASTAKRDLKKNLPRNPPAVALQSLFPDLMKDSETIRTILALNLSAASNEHTLRKATDLVETIVATAEAEAGCVLSDLRRLAGRKVYMLFRRNSTSRDVWRMYWRSPICRWYMPQLRSIAAFWWYSRRANE